MNGSAKRRPLSAAARFATASEAVRQLSAALRVNLPAPRPAGASLQAAGPELLPGDPLHNSRTTPVGAAATMELGPPLVKQRWIADGSRCSRGADHRPGDARPDFGRVRRATSRSYPLPRPPPSPPRPPLRPSRSRSPIPRPRWWISMRSPPRPTARPAATAPKARPKAAPKAPGPAQRPPPKPIYSRD